MKRTEHGDMETLKKGECMKLKPMKDFIIGKFVEEKKTGILLSTEPERVKFLVEGVADNINDIFVGDLIYARPSAYFKLEVDNAEFIMVRYESVIAKWDTNP